MTDTAGVPRKCHGEPGRRPLIDQELADRPLDRPRPRARSCSAPDGVLSQVTRAVLERALGEEMTGHLGEKHDPAGRGSGNSRNGTTAKTVLTEVVGAVDLAVPRDRNGSFEPRSQGPDRAGRIQRPDARAVRAGHDHPRHPRAPARDV
jgi:hypothetical protein